VASTELNVTSSALAKLASGLSGKDRENGFYYPGASDYLLDVSDGQMFFEQVTVYDDHAHWDDADYQFFRDYPRADVNIVHSITSTAGHVHVQANGSFGINPWDQLAGYSTLIHEFGHYAIGAYDEYKFHQDGDGAKCTLVPDPRYDLRASIMEHQDTSSEFCTDLNHNPQTRQGLLLGTSVWSTLLDNWDDSSGRWTLLSPIQRGFVDGGPSLGDLISREAMKAVPTIIAPAVAACEPIELTVQDAQGTPIRGASLTLEHNNIAISEGVTFDYGFAYIEGAVAGHDRVTAASGLGIPFLQTGSAEVTSCDPMTITVGLLQDKGARDQSVHVQPNSTWPTYWLTGTANYSQGEVDTTLHFVADPSDQPLLYASQGGTDRLQVPLSYDPVGHNYTGAYPFDINRATDFQFEVGLTGTTGLDLLTHKFDAAQFHATGPVRTEGIDSRGVTDVPSEWDLFGPESQVNLGVNPSSLPDGTGVMAGGVLLPAAAPDDLLAVGGPISVQGENPISGTVHLDLAFQSENFCGLLPNSIHIYHHNGTGWDPLSTAVDAEWHAASADITEWGIYAVFAQPNPQVVFSDVPQGSTFYDYINWITCHSIASGYSDGTFRPNNNATRGQISKMVANAFQWHLDPPTNGNTFTDVPPGSTFFLYVEAAYREGVVSGYPCGGAGEPCVPPTNKPYFRPNRNVTRGQIAKIISNGARYEDAPVGQTFQDVAPGSTFYTYTQRIASRSIINGYPCGGAGEPCVPPTNRPYFRPNANATRGQLSKIIYLALVPR
jgi:hypothetical protein